jgi:hypothetical protein
VKAVASAAATAYGAPPALAEFAGSAAVKVSEAQAAEAAAQAAKDAPSTPAKKNGGSGGGSLTPTTTPAKKLDNGDEDEEDDAPKHLLLDPALMLPFTLPSATDMLVSYGAGFGGMNREREHKYIPTLPPEFLAKLESSNYNNGNRRPMFGEKDWEDEEV